MSSPGYLLQRLLPHYSTLSKKEKHQGSLYNPIDDLREKHRKQKKDFRIICAGDPGNGKSSFALVEGENQNPETFIRHPEWAIDHQVHLHAKDWLGALDYLNFFDVNVFDEPVQGGGHHREFMSEANIILTKTAGTMRFLRLDTPMNIPFLDMLDKDLRKLCQIYVHPFDQGKAEVYLIINQKFGGDPWFNKILDEYTWDMPNHRLWKLYEKKKYSTEREEYKAYHHKLTKRERDQRTDQELLEELRGAGDKLLGKNGKVSVTAIMAVTDTGRDKASRLRLKYQGELDEEQSNSKA